MGRNDPLPTQRDSTAGIPAELAAAGFTDPAEIGAGGFGVVYRCTQRALDRTVAVKVLTADLDPDNIERFVREQVAMGKLSGHPNIVTIFQVGTVASGRPYIVMQYHPHGSLGAKIGDSGPIGWQEALRIGVTMAGALETAHRRGMLHRDVKPANILLTEYGAPQLADFGIARVIGGFETADGAVTGSPAYTAPEVLLGQPPDVTSDIYSLASTLFSAGTGHAVFERRKGEQMVAQFLRITKHPTPSLRDSGLPADVCALIEQAMSRDVADRPQTAETFGEAMRELQRLHGLPVDDMPLPMPAPLNRSDTAAAPGVTPGVYRARAATPPTPATRFRLPVSAKALVARHRLLDALRAQQRKTLTVIHGPTGFGKSTLAAQWAELMRADGVTVAWLTVDHDDNNVTWFLAHLVEAIDTVTPALASDLGELLEAHGDEAERYVLTSLINQIHESGTRMTLVIDDWHQVSDPATVAALRYLLDNVADGLTVVVTSRSRAGLPMSRMRMRDELVEIDAAALRFDVSESTNLLVALGGLELDDAEIEELTEKTDGWVAALQLASLSLRDLDDPARLIGTMTGRHHVISEFLAENVLDALEPSMRIQAWAAPIYDRSGDAFSVVNGLCFTGLAHHLMLDNIAAEGYFRKALRTAKRAGGVHSYPARLAASMLGELLYERDDVDGAEGLLEEGYKLGPEGGSVDFKIARYVISARIKALRGDRLAAAQRLDEATRVANTLSLNRLRALAEHERIRLGLPPHPEFGPMPTTSYDARREAVDGMDEIAVQFEEASAIRSLIASDDPAKRELACRWAQEWVDTLAAKNHPQAMLRARRLLGACLAADGRTDEAKATLVAVAAQCAQLQMLRYLIDGGPQVVAILADLRADLRARRWRPEWPEVPAEFLDRAVISDAPQRI